MLSETCCSVRVQQSCFDMLHSLPALPSNYFAAAAATATAVALPMLQHTNANMNPTPMLLLLLLLLLLPCNCHALPSGPVAAAALPLHDSTQFKRCKGSTKQRHDPGSHCHVTFAVTAAANTLLTWSGYSTSEHYPSNMKTYVHTACLRWEQNSCKCAQR